MTQTQPKPPQNAIAYFTDVAQKAGLTVPIVFGGKDTKKSQARLRPTTFIATIMTARSPTLPPKPD